VSHGDVQLGGAEGGGKSGIGVTVSQHPIGHFL
jgi:hypothetical protein